MSGDGGGERTLDLRGFRCPLPVLKAAKALDAADSGATLAILSDDPLAAVDIPNMLRERGHELIELRRENGVVRFRVRRALLAT